MAATNFRELPIVQTEIRQIVGSPEAVMYAPFGYIVVTEAGNIYVKKSDITLNTGWKLVTTAA